MLSIYHCKCSTQSVDCAMLNNVKVIYRLGIWELIYRLYYIALQLYTKYINRNKQQTYPALQLFPGSPQQVVFRYF